MCTLSASAQLTPGDFPPAAGLSLLCTVITDQGWPFLQVHIRDYSSSLLNNVNTISIVCVTLHCIALSAFHNCHSELILSKVFSYIKTNIPTCLSYILLTHFLNLWALWLSVPMPVTTPTPCRPQTGDPSWPSQGLLTPPQPGPATVTPGQRQTSGQCALCKIVTTLTTFTWDPDDWIYICTRKITSYA